MTINRKYQVHYSTLLGESQLEQIKIQGISYRICVENNLIRDSGTQAEINFVDRIIRIDSAIYGTDRGNIALLHEVIHGILEGLCFEEENENEHLIQCLASSMHQVFVDNKDFVATISS